MRIQTSRGTRVSSERRLERTLGRRVQALAGRLHPEAQREARGNALGLHGEANVHQEASTGVDQQPWAPVGARSEGWGGGGGAQEAARLACSLEYWGPGDNRGWAQSDLVSFYTDQQVVFTCDSVEPGGGFMDRGCAHTVGTSDGSLYP